MRRQSRAIGLTAIAASGMGLAVKQHIIFCRMVQKARRQTMRKAQSRRHISRAASRYFMQPAAWQTATGMGAQISINIGKPRRNTCPRLQHRPMVRHKSVQSVQLVLPIGLFHLTV